MDWGDITYNQYIELQSVNNTDDDVLDKGIAYLTILYGEDASKWSISKFNEKTNEISFLSTPIPKVKVKSDYGEYHIDLSLPELTVAQWIDYQNFVKANDIIGILSVFLRPNGKEYLDGYDIATVKEFIGNMAVADVISLYAFFLRYWESYQIISQLYLLKQARKARRKIKRKRRWMKILFIKSKWFSILQKKLIWITTKFKK